MTTEHDHRLHAEAGIALAELLVATAIFLIVSAGVTAALNQMASSQQTIWNRTEMHSGVRSATEVLQQEVGQAGRIALPGARTTSGASAMAATSFAVNSAPGFYVGQMVTVDAGDHQETIKIGSINGTTIGVDATYAANPVLNFAHASGAPVNVFGGFASGIVPPSMANGSTGTVLKLYGDINGDGNMVYVEYTCDVAAGNLYRNAVAWTAGAKPALGPAQVLLENVIANPGGAPCFTYQEQTVSGTVFVTNVAITLTVQTQRLDPVTKQYQTETKALLNVAPRNVFDVWELASQNQGSNRVQTMPASVAALLP